MLTGKGMYIWNIDQCERGDIAAIVGVAKQAGLSHVLIKIADGTYKFGGDKAVELSQRMLSSGIIPIGWQYVYGNDPFAEAKIAADRIKKTGVKGFVVNAEHEFKRMGWANKAEAYMDTLRLRYPKLPMGLSSYRFPSLHREFPFTSFFKYVNFNLPQVYWQGAQNAGFQLRRCVSEFKQYYKKLPIIPTGSAYTEHNWTAQPSEVLEFMHEAKKLGIKAVNFWEWSHARRLPGIWDVIQNTEWKKPKWLIQKLRF